MTLNDLTARLEATPLSIEMAQSAWLFPSVESVHVIALTLVVGSIAAVDLRLIGLTSRQRPIRDLLAALLPLTWSAFAVAAVSGALLFCAKPTNYVANTFFQLKALLLLAAGVNMAVFHLVVERRLEPRDTLKAPGLARASGWISLILWVGVIAAGRWIGFTVDQ